MTDGLRYSDLRVGMEVNVTAGAGAGSNGVVHEIDGREYPLILVGGVTLIGKRPSELAHVEGPEHD